MKRDYPLGFVAKIGPAKGKKLTEVPIDPDVKLPAEIQATIRRGEQAFKRESKRRKQGRAQTCNPAPEGSTAVPSFITSVGDEEVQNHRESMLEAKAQQSRGKRGQPPRLDRLRVVWTIVDRLQAEGVRFATGRNSKMNKLVREWLNVRAARSPHDSKSRRKQLTPDAVQELLKQVERHRQ